MDTRPSVTLSRQQLNQPYLQPLNGSAKENLYEGEIERIVHGVMHASRTECWSIIFANMIAEIKENFNPLITSKDRLYSKIAIRLHDCARKGENTDVWEAESEEQCQQVLEAVGLSPEQAYFYASLITTKEGTSGELDNDERGKILFLRIILQCADALDVMRCVKEFEIEKLTCWDLFEEAGQTDKLIELAKNALDVIADQQDLLFNCKIMLKGKCLYQRRATMLDKYKETLKESMSVKDEESDELQVEIISNKDLKKAYEHSPHCHEKIQADILQKPFLKQYSNDNAEALDTLTYLETAAQEERRLIRNSASTFDINDFFVVKGLRNGLHTQEFLEGVLPDNIHHPLRTAPKGKYVVNGAGIFERAKKKPQYTAEEKKSYSKAQPATLGTAAYQPPVFNFGNGHQKLVGALFLDKSDFLLSNHIYIDDFGSEARPNDFDDEYSADMYLKKNTAQKTLYSAANIDKYKKKVESEEFKTQNKTPEALIRLRWSANNQCKIMICTDTLDTRLLAQVHAQLIKQRLLEKNACDPDYAVSIVYYNPRNPAIHKREYTIEEQRLDKKIAAGIASSPEYRHLKYGAFSFEFLFGLSQEAFSDVYDQDNNTRLPLLAKMALDQNPHFNDIFVELGMLDKHELGKTILSLFTAIEQGVIAVLTRAESDPLRPSLHETITNLMGILIVAIQKNNQVLFNTIWNCMLENEDFLPLILKANSYVEQCLLQMAIAQTKNSHYLQCLLHLPLIDFDYLTENKQQSMLHTAAKSPYSTHLRICLEAGKITHINTQDKNGLTPLHYAALYGNLDSVKALLAVPGINPFIKDKSGYSPLHYAFSEDKLSIVKCFISTLKMDPASLDETGKNVMQYASEYPAFNILRYYLEIDTCVKVNKQDKFGDNVLHTMVKLCEKRDRLSGVFAVVIGGSLFKQGIKPYLKNLAGFTPLELAIQQNDTKLINAIVTNQVERIKTLLDEAQLNKKILSFEARSFIINALFNNIAEYPSHGYKPAILDSDNLIIDLLVELDKLSLVYLDKLAKIKNNQALGADLHKVLDTAYSRLAVDQVKTLDYVRQQADALLKEQKPSVSIANSSYGKFSGKPQDKFTKQEDKEDDVLSFCQLF